MNKRIICIILATMILALGVYIISSPKADRSLESYRIATDMVYDSSIITESVVNTEMEDDLDSGNHYQLSTFDSIENIPSVIKNDYRWSYIIESGYVSGDPISVTVITYSDYYEVQIAYTDYYIMIIYNFDGSLFVAELFGSVTEDYEQLIPDDVITQKVYVPPYGYDENGNVVVPNVTTTTYEYEIPDYVTEYFTTGDGHTFLKQEVKYIEDILGIELTVSDVEILRFPDDFYYYANYKFENIPLGITAIYTWEMPDAEFAVYDMGNTVESGAAFIYFPDGIPDNLSDIYYSPSYPASMTYGVCLGHEGDTYYLRDMETNVDYTVTIGM